MNNTAEALEDKVGNKITVAITQIVDHPSLDQARLGIIEALAQHGFIENKNIDISYQSAQGNITTASQIIQKFMAQSPKLIIAISTPSAQIALKAAKNAHIPIVFSSVTDPYTAGLLAKDQTSSNIITGSIDAPPLVEIIEMMQRFIPKITKIGVIYSPSEINSVKTISELKTLLSTYPIDIEEAIANNSGQVNMAISSLMGKVDAIFIPSDNIVFSALDILIRICETEKTPLFTADPDAVRKGVLGCVGYDQKSVGYAAGELAAQILQGINPNQLPIKKPHHKLILINEKAMKALNLSLPSAYKKTAQIIK